MRAYTSKQEDQTDTVKSMNFNMILKIPARNRTNVWYCVEIDARLWCKHSIFMGVAAWEHGHGIRMRDERVKRYAYTHTNK
jgi:hypothetical protein